MTPAGSATSATDASAPDQNTGGNTCFHCGLPLDPKFDAVEQILGKPRQFCCAGCHAVARSIVDAGLESYYEHRREKAVTADVVPEILQKLEFYDHPDVQKSFVRDAAEVREASLLLENIRCAACLWLNERVLRGLDGVIDVELDYASHHARVRWDPARIKLSEILQGIISIGYVAHPYDAKRREELNALQRQRSTERLLFAGVIGMAVMNFAIAGYVMGYSDETGEIGLWVLIGRWTSLFATAFLLAYPGQEFFTGAWRDLRNGRLGMDVPIALGLSIAFIGSIYTTITQVGDVYYDSIAMFIFLVLLARRIELRGRVRATDALDRVGKVLPRTAMRIDADGREEEVLVTALTPGDRVRVSPGEIVPADGRLHQGFSTFDESLLTGESLPVAHSEGERIIGGSCNVDQAVVIEIDRGSNDSTIAEIHRLLTNGMQDAPRYAVIAQRAAGWFVTAVLIIASATAAFWLWVEPAMALPNTVAVLIVTCPCAFALATPVAAAIAVGRLADSGLLTVRSDALEHFADCDVVAFDKTGTLTDGNLSISDVQPFGGLDRDSALKIAAGLEQGSEHPVGRALAAATADPVAISGRRNHVGSGIQGEAGGISWRIGKRTFVEPVLIAGVTAPAFPAPADGMQILLAGSDGTGAVFTLRDQRRDGVTTVAAALHDLGINEVALLSGDNSANVTRFALNLGFDTVLGDLTPGDKLAWIRSHQSAGKRVAMIGDGINDAPTLAAADVSLSFAHATELAQVNSGLLVLGNDIGLIPESRRLAAKTRRVIRQNLAWAAAYNFLAVPAAAAGFIAPWGAAIGMSLSSLLVVINALRLRKP